MQPDLRKTLLDAAKEPLEPADLEIGVKAALHQHTGAAHFESLGDFVADGFELEDVAVARGGAGLAVDWQRAVEGADVAIFSEVIGVVDVAIDDVCDHALRMQTSAHSVGLKSQPDQVRRFEILEGLLARDRHSFNFSNSAGNS